MNDYKHMHKSNRKPSEPFPFWETFGSLTILFAVTYAVMYYGLVQMTGGFQ